jgi:Dihydroorotate dehydrogenase
LQKKSTAIIRHIAQKTRMPIIGCGGIFDIDSAREKIEAGAKCCRFTQASFIADRI